MLNRSEKAYYQALQALERKDYHAAVGCFEKAAPHFETNEEFRLFHESTRLLLAVRQELTALVKAEDELEIKEVFSDGQETDIRR